MPKKRIEKLIAEAAEYKTENPETPLSVFEVAVLILMGADASTPKPANLQRPRGFEEFKAAAQKFTGPFTAEDLARATLGRLVPDTGPTRLQLNAAGRAARAITGSGPRRSNGKLLFDPIA